MKKDSIITHYNQNREGKYAYKDYQLIQFTITNLILKNKNYMSGPNQIDALARSIITIERKPREVKI